MVSFCDVPVVGYDLADVTIDDLKPDDAVRLLVASRHSRKAVKRHLNNLGLPDGSPDVDKTLAAIRQRSDFASLQAAADQYGFDIDRSSAPSTKFNPLVDLRRQLKVLMESPDDFAARVAATHGLNASDIRAAMAGHVDPPASVLVAMLDSARAQRISFAPPPRPRR